MSTWVYAQLTTRRERGDLNVRSATPPPPVSTYLDAVAALVPAEVLTLHGVVLSFTTTSVAASDGGASTTTVSEPGTLAAAFWVLAVLSVVLYVIPRLRNWNRLDYLRAAIPPFAFVAWTMLQRSTAFDAVWPGLADAPRTLVALVLAVVLGLAAGALAKKADQTAPAS